MSNISNESSGQPSADIHIDSSTDNKRVISIDNYSDIVYYFYGGSLHVSDGFVFLISLNDAIIPVTWYVISEYNQNNIFNYEVSEVSYSYTIPDGNYSVNGLINLFNASEIKTTNGITTSYSLTTNKLTFSHTSLEFTILSASTCWKLIGLSKNVDATSTSFILTCPKQVNLSGTKAIYIKSNLHTISLDTRIGTMTSSILAKIPVVMDTYNFINYVNITQNRKILKDRSINKIQITSEDDQGRPLDITDDYNLTIDVHIIPNKYLIYENALTK